MQIDWSFQDLTTAQLQQRLSSILTSEQQVASLNLKNNQIDDMTPLYQALIDPIFSSLKILNVSQNLITDVYLTELPQLITCDFSHNPGLREPVFVGLRQLKSLDLRGTAITDDFFVQLVSQDIKLRHLRVGGTVTDAGVERGISQNKAFFADLLTLDLKMTQCEKYRTLSSIQGLLGVKTVKNLPQKLPSLNSSRLSSNSSARSVSQFSTFDVYKNLTSNNAKSIIKKSPAQVFIQALLGPNQPLQAEFQGLCELQKGSGVCAALLAGVKAQPDLEDVLGAGFVRKVGTIFCKDVKMGSIGCDERVKIVCDIAEKKILVQNENVPKGDLQKGIVDQQEIEGELFIVGKSYG